MKLRNGLKRSVLVGNLALSLLISACGQSPQASGSLGGSWHLSLSGAVTDEIGYDDASHDLACATRVSPENDLDYFAFVLRDTVDLSASALTFEYVEIEESSEAAYIWLEQRTKIYEASDAAIRSALELGEDRVTGGLEASLRRGDEVIELRLSQLDIPLGLCASLPYVPSTAGLSVAGIR